MLTSITVATAMTMTITMTTSRSSQGPLKNDKARKRSTHMLGSKSISIASAASINQFLSCVSFFTSCCAFSISRAILIRSLSFGRKPLSIGNSGRAFAVAVSASGKTCYMKGSPGSRLLPRVVQYMIAQHYEPERKLTHSCLDSSSDPSERSYPPD